MALTSGDVRHHGELPGDVVLETVAVSDAGAVTVAAGIDNEVVQVWHGTGGAMAPVGTLRAKD